MNNHSLQNTEEEPIVVETTAATQEVASISGRSHFTRKNTRFRAPALHKPQSTFMISTLTASLILNVVSHY